jgi:hypothetical protein
MLEVALEVFPGDRNDRGFLGREKGLSMAIVKVGKTLG